jgi:hypothetical protein
VAKFTIATTTRANPNGKDLVAARNTNQKPDHNAAERNQRPETSQTKRRELIEPEQARPAKPNYHGNTK